MALDALFVAVFSWGAAGAAAATALSQFIGGSLPLVYFARPNSSLLRLGKCRMDLRALRKTCSNGSSEFMSNVSMSLVSMLYNVQLMKYAGEDGVSAYGVLMYVNMIFQAIYIGYSVGAAPVVSFHYGAGNRGAAGPAAAQRRPAGRVRGVHAGGGSGFWLRRCPRLYVGYDPGLFRMTSHAFSIFSFSFLFSGFAIYGSSFFTALNDRAHLRHHRVLAGPGVPGGSGAAVPAVVEAGRHLDVHRGGGGHGPLSPQVSSCWPSGNSMATKKRKISKTPCIPRKGVV